MPPIGGKKPFTQALPEPALEPIQDTAIVVIHPGSNSLRLGRASDAYPHTVPHCVARRHKYPGKQTPYEDQWLVREEAQHTDSESLRLQGQQSAEGAIRKKPVSTGQMRQCTGLHHMSEINRGVKAEVTGVASSKRWTDTSLKDNYFIGEEALYISPDETYSLHWPISRGRFHLHEGPGGSLSGVLQDLETIWGVAIQKYLDIPLRDLKYYRAVLLIPDIYKRLHVREMMSLLLNRLGFAAAFCVQESVCATFGSGLASACVVDIGDQKTSVCCVEDGFSQKRTRLCMDFGGSDVTRAFHWLLRRAGFPYRDCDLGRRMDAVFLQQLKENHCHLDPEIQGTSEVHIQVHHPQRKVTKYTLHMGDERILASMAVFYPDLFGLVGKHLCHNPEPYWSDPSDPHDEDYLTQTMSKHEQAARLVALRKKETAEQVNQSIDGSCIIDDPDDEDTMDPLEVTAGDPLAAGSTKVAKWRMDEDDDEVDISQGLVGLDQAIISSVEMCETDDMKKRMYSCLLVVGGGLMMEGSQAWLQNSVWGLMSPQMRLALEVMDVITQPKELNPMLTCWKGGAILSCLDTAQELWIRQREWQKYGARVLRERALFNW